MDYETAKEKAQSMADEMCSDCVIYLQYDSETETDIYGFSGARAFMDNAYPRCFGSRYSDVELAETIEPSQIVEN